MFGPGHVMPQSRAMNLHTSIAPNSTSPIAKAMGSLNINPMSRAVMKTYPSKFASGPWRLKNQRVGHRLNKCGVECQKFHHPATPPQTDPISHHFKTQSRTDNSKSN